MLIDTHAHVNFNVYKNDVNEVIRKSLQKKTWLIIHGSEYKTSKRALEIANKFEQGVYAGVGLHPIHLQEQEIEEEGKKIITRAEEFNYDIYEKLAKFEKVVAIGEIGLDYYYTKGKEDVTAIKDKQKTVLWKQLFLARQLNLPVVIHCRQAHDDLIALLQKFKKENKKLFPVDKFWGVIHCFSGNEDLAWQYFSLGLMISFTGLITFSRQWDDLIRRLPNDRFMIETDSPFMTPEPYRGQRNEPILVKFVAERIAKIKNLSLERVAELTTLNARELFKI